MEQLQETPEASAVPRAEASGASEGGGAALVPVSNLYAKSDSEVERLLQSAGVSLPCERPILVVDRETGETIKVRCGTRRAADCVSCSALYMGDASAILRAGALDVDPGATIVMLTLTAPSFGAVHRVPKAASPRISADSQKAWSKRASRTRCRCGVDHGAGDRLAGVALDPDGYDYESQAAWNASFGRLWNRTSTRLTRDLGLGERLAYAGTTEWQARGVVHAHVLLRVPASTHLGLFSDRVGRLRSGAIEESARAVGTTVAGREIRWGTAVLAEVIAAPGMDDGRHAKRTLGYLRKALAYTVKDLTEGHAGAESAHFHRCQIAGQAVHCPACGGGPLHGRCQSPRHRSLGYAGHAVRKSRSWSVVSFAALRANRVAWQRNSASTEGPTRSWTVVGRAHGLGSVDSLRRSLRETHGAERSISVDESQDFSYLYREAARDVAQS